MEKEKESKQKKWYNILLQVCAFIGMGVLLGIVIAETKKENIIPQNSPVKLWVWRSEYLPASDPKKTGTTTYILRLLPDTMAWKTELSIQAPQGWKTAGDTVELK